jgi:hypothetical protein
MRTPRCMPKVRNGAVAKRQARSKNTATSTAFNIEAGISRLRHPRSRRNSGWVSNRGGALRRSEGREGRVMWLMILTGVALTAGFVFALRSHINAYRIAQAEEKLKMKLEEYASQQQFLTLDQKRALSASESERAGRQNGLDQLKLDSEAAQLNASVQRLVSQPPVRAPRADQIEGLGEGMATNSQSEPRLIKRLVKPGSQAKVVKAVKAGKTAKVLKIINVKVVKLNPAKSSGAANKARANVVRTKKRR